jgi:hypothetical protein
MTKTTEKNAIESLIEELTEMVLAPPDCECED